MTVAVNSGCSGMTVPPRHPYAGELVFTAFSGSHQDAIKKGLTEWAKTGRTHWDVPYLTIDPTDIGREYREVIRVNSQSGKGGVAYLLESEFGIELPKEMQRDFGPIANDEVDRLGREVSGAELKAMFWREYIERTNPWQLQGFETDSRNGVVKCRARMLRSITRISPSKISAPCIESPCTGKKKVETGLRTRYSLISRRASS